MNTATAIGMMERETEMRKRGFELQLESFMRQWGPDDPRERAEFEMQFVSLVRQIYTDAQAPILDRFTKLAMSIPMPSFISPNT